MFPKAPVYLLFEQVSFGFLDGVLVEICGTVSHPRRGIFEMSLQGSDLIAKALRRIDLRSSKDFSGVFVSIDDTRIDTLRFNPVPLANAQQVKNHLRSYADSARRSGCYHDASMAEIRLGELFHEDDELAEKVAL